MRSFIGLMQGFALAGQLCLGGFALTQIMVIAKSPLRRH